MDSNPQRSDVFKFDRYGDNSYSNIFGTGGINSRGDQEEDEDVYRYIGNNRNPGPSDKVSCGGAVNCCSTASRCIADKGNRVTL